MKLVMARDDANKNNTSKQVGPDLNKPYVQVVKQQVKEHQENLHEILVKLHTKFI